MVEHETIFGGISTTGIKPSPTILQRTDENFVGALLDELGGDNGVMLATDARKQKLAQTRDKDRVLRLYQPVHRTFHVALLEVACNFQGQYPRLDPESIDSCGLVVRRIERKGGRDVEQKWMYLGRTIRGWVDIERPDQTELDPEPERRPLAFSTGNAEIDRRLLLNYKATLAGRPDVNQLYETVAPLFVAPPRVNAATRKTILFGMIPVTSADKSEAPTPTISFDDSVKQHLSGYLRSGVNTPFSSLAKKQFTYAQATNPRPAPNTELGRFMLFLQQLSVEFNAFGDTPEAKRLFAELNTIQLSFASTTGNTRKAGDFLKEAKAVLVDGEGESSSRAVRMPDAWPTISAVQETRLLSVIKPALSARFAEIRPQEGRFDNLTSKYLVRAFVRVKRADGCPPRLIWSRPSEPFTIVPWYESGPMPPVSVVLPSIDRDFLKNVKPNVSFVVPSDLANMLQGNDPKKMSDGEGQKVEGGLQLDWICSFNLPVITFCAFIVLNIFLSLFDIIFRWMFFIKICIPIPAGKSPLPKK